MFLDEGLKKKKNQKNKINCNNQNHQWWNCVSYKKKTTELINEDVRKRWQVYKTGHRWWGDRLTHNTGMCSINSFQKDTFGLKQCSNNTTLSKCNSCRIANHQNHNTNQIEAILGLYHHTIRNRTTAHISNPTWEIDGHVTLIAFGNIHIYLRHIVSSRLTCFILNMKKRIVILWDTNQDSSMIESKQYKPYLLFPLPPTHRGDTNVFPSQLRNINLSSFSFIHPRVSSEPDTPKNPSQGKRPGGILTRFLNHLSWLLSTRRRRSTTH